MIVVFLGPPGAGKGTQCKLIVDRYGLAHLSSGDILRKERSECSELGKQALAGTRYQIEVETTQPSPQAIKFIEKVKGVVKVEAKDNRLLIGADSDLRAEIAKVMVSNNFPLIQMSIQTFTLDDIYMKYFHGG